MLDEIRTLLVLQGYQIVESEPDMFTFGQKYPIHNGYTWMNHGLIEILYPNRCKITLYPGFDPAPVIKRCSLDEAFSFIQDNKKLP